VPERAGRVAAAAAVAAVLTSVLLVAFAALVVLAATRNPGYSHRRDFVSALASDGAAAAGVGMAAITTYALAHAAAAFVLRRGGGLRVAPVLLGLCAASGVVTALARIACPAGAAGCGTDGRPVPDGLSDRVHGAAVATYAALVVLAMLAVVPAAASSLRARRGPGAGPAGRVPRGAGLLALASPALAVASAGSVLRLGGADTGAWQRAWLATNAGWLLLAVAACVRPVRGARREGTAQP
jgi:Protein of unknown function (DUF998)